MHPNGKLVNKKSGMGEFAITDNEGNLIKFSQKIEG